MDTTQHLPLLDVPRGLVVHHVLVDSSARGEGQSNYEYVAYLGREGIIKNVVSVNLLNCLIPQNDTNVREDSNQLYVREFYHDEQTWRYATASVLPGFYASSQSFCSAVKLALSQANRMPELQNAADAPEYDISVMENSQTVMHIVDRSSGASEFVSYTQSGARVSFALVLDGDRRAILYKLGFDRAHPLYADGDNTLLARSRFTSNRLVDISTTDFVDIDIPEIPSVGLKMTTITRRLFARVPTARTRSTYVVPDRGMTRQHFHPINLEKITLRLYDQYGLPYENNNSDHTIELEVVSLGTATNSFAAANSFVPRTLYVDRREAHTVETEQQQQAAVDAPPPSSSGPIIHIPKINAHVALAVFGTLGTIVIAYRALRIFSGKKPSSSSPSLPRVLV